MIINFEGNFAIIYNLLTLQFSPKNILIKSPGPAGVSVNGNLCSLCAFLVANESNFRSNSLRSYLKTKKLINYVVKLCHGKSLEARMPKLVQCIQIFKEFPHKYPEISDSVMFANGIQAISRTFVIQMLITFSATKNFNDAKRKISFDTFSIVI